MNAELYGNCNIAIPATVVSSDTVSCDVETRAYTVPCILAGRIAVVEPFVPVPLMGTNVLFRPVRSARKSGVELDVPLAVKSKEREIVCPAWPATKVAWPTTLRAGNGVKELFGFVAGQEPGTMKPDAREIACRIFRGV